MTYFNGPTEDQCPAAYSGIPHMYNPPCSSYMSDSMSLLVNGAGAAYVANFEGPTYEGWYLDSGATHHLTNKMANMHVRDEFRGNDKLIIGNGKGLSITHVGNITLTVQSSKLQYVCTCIELTDILLVLSITKNLISVSKLTTDNNLSVEFLGSVCFVKDILKGKILLQGIAEKGLYKLLLNSSPQSAYTVFISQSSINKHVSMLSQCYLNTTINSSCSEKCFQLNTNTCSTNSFNKMSLFHRKFGHPNTQSLIHLLKLVHPTLFSVNIFNQATKHLCEACQTEKFYRLHFPITDIKSKSSLELVHIDLWGPSPICSRDGYKYYISFVDDHTRYT